MRDLPAPPVLINWLTPFMTSQHAFVGGFRSLCERQRYSARLEVDRQAPFCRDCLSLVKVAVALVLDDIVDSEAEAGYADQDLRMRQEAMSESTLVAGYGGLPSDDR